MSDDRGCRVSAGSRPQPDRGRRRRRPQSRGDAAVPAAADHRARRDPDGVLWYRIARRPPDQLVPAAQLDPLLLIPSLFFLALGLMLVGQFVMTGQVAAHRHPARADRRTARGRGRHRRRQGRGRPLAAAVPVAPQLRQGDGRPAAPRPAVRGRPRHRQDLHRQGPGRRGRRAVPVRDGDVVPVQLPGRDRAQGAQFFRALRKAARKHGGAIGFIDEFDAIGLARNGCRRR